jgi:hypothetical protein
MDETAQFLKYRHATPRLERDGEFANGVLKL